MTLLNSADVSTMIAPAQRFALFGARVCRNLVMQLDVSTSCFASRLHVLWSGTGQKAPHSRAC